MANYADLEHDESATVLAARLRAARESSGLTQAQAASELGVSRPLLIAIEKGTRDASPEEIVRLAEIYGKPVGELLRPSPPPTAIGARFRAALAFAADTGELAGAVSQLEQQADNYIDLLRRACTEAPGRYPPARSISHLDPGQAGEDLATEERNRLGIGDGPIRQLREVLEIEVGLRVFLLPLPRQVAGLFVYVDELGGCIGVNISHPSERRHWTMAHEYAHYLATRDRAEVTPVSHRRRPHETERFADAFAANFLMPRSGLSRRFHELKRSKEGKVTPAMLVQLAHAYGVSVQALTLRLEDLRLIAQGTWDRLLDNDFQPRAAARLLGFDPAERSAEALPLHYRLLAVQLYADGEITEPQLARYLGTDIVGARCVYQKLTETRDVADDGSPQIVDLAETTG
ncbi:MAG TPA: XRE family transcriptional regulator [Streptosporangiaceae bacterium]|nr:XRE family transcriptional regulator [Streptosporangiaceae bacterium]